MWEVYRLPLRGNFSLRTLVALFTAAILTTLFGALLNSQPVAAAPGKAEWQNDNIVYDGKEYTPDSTQNIPGIPAGATVFSRKDETAGKVSVIYYEQGADTTKETKLKVIEYTLNNDGTYSSPGPPVDATLSEKKSGNGSTSQCAIAGVGWIVCQMSRWIATGMDGIFKLIANYLVVQPITTDRDNALYKSWEIARSIANLCFVLAFLMIIYAQITSQGLSNYEIKKMIPKLIVAAVLVNISYYICAIAVDVSNILGQGIQQALVDIRKSIPQTGGEVAISWKNFTEYIMSGGAVAAAGIVGAKAFAGGTVAGTFSSLGLMLAPVLVGALIAVLIAVIILAARQALIIVLIVASPLAFVAMLLPNTEKWFEKWKDLLITMLLVFPMFSLLFGGSQLASHIVMGSTDDLSVKLLALFIQAAPLVMTPFLVKFSGSLLGRFAGMMNDPQKGLVDRTRNWATDKAEANKGRAFARVAEGGGNRWQRKAYKKEKDQANRDGWKKIGSEAVQAGWANDARSHRQHKTMARLDALKEVGESASKLEIADMKLNDANISRAIAVTRLNEEKAKNLEARQEAAWQEMRAGKNTHQFGVTPGTVPAADQLEFGNRMAAQAAQASDEAKALAHRTAMAQSVQNTEYSSRVLQDAILAQQAAGIMGDAGVAQAKAQALQTSRADFGKNSGAIKEMMDHFKLSGDQVKDIANMRQDITVQDGDGNAFTFKANDAYAIDAAIESVFEKKGNYKDMKEIVMKSGTAEYEPYRATIAAGVASKMTAKAGFMGGRSIDTVTVGDVATPEQYNDVIRRAIAGGKFKQEFFATNDTDALKDVLKIMENNLNHGSLDPEEASYFHDNVQKLSAMAKATLGNENISGSLTEGSINVLKKIRDQFGAGS